MSFVHLHVHSEYSLLDGACRLKNLIDGAAALGQDAVAITDHGNMYGAVDFYKLAKEKGIKPIIGCEVYVAPRTRFDKISDSDRSNYHMVLLCKNEIGYRNLIAMVSKGFTEGFYNKPRIDDDLLKEHHQGLICLSACLAGELPRMILMGNYTGAKEKAMFYQNLFGRGNYYLELQDHGINDQKTVNRQLLQISKETDIPLVATNDCHYIKKEDSKIHSILLCIQTNHTILDENKMEFPTDEFYLKSEEEMSSLFSNCPQAIENTQKIADMCNFDFEFGSTKLPHFDVPNNEDHYDYFRRQCYNGLKKHYGKAPDKKIVDRLEYELGIVKEMGYVDYYLIVNDFISYAKSVGIPVGPGRGSGAGSLAAYCIGITGIDPIKYNLLFERFLNPERVSMPDFDVDFCKDRRQEVIDYVIRKYGADHVAQIIAFGTMAARGAVRDVARAMAVPYSTADNVAKLIPFEIGMTISKALTVSPKLKELYDTDNQIHTLLDTAVQVEGMPRNATTHAAGVVITKDPVSTYVPLAKNDDAIVTQYTMTRLEELGLLKMDFLGLRNLTVIHDAEVMIRHANPDYSEDDISEDDKQVFDMLSRGFSEGVFQFESTGMKNVLTQLKPESVEDLIAVISLYRPGPMDSIPKYIVNRHNPEKVTYKHPLLKDILDVTYGCIIYQEQVMQIFRSLAGYSLGRADIVRRAMSKKKKNVMEAEKKIFIDGLTDDKGNIEVEGCLRRGVSREVALSVYAEMESFASYAFNKSHAAAYANISYKTAWMKCHYPKEYMAALLTSVLDNTNKMAGYIAECQRLNIKVLPPDVNISTNDFTVSGNDIRFGLLAVKNLGRAFIDSIVAQRKNGSYKSCYDFCKRLYGKNMNSRAVESLIKCGALDNLGNNRREMLSGMKQVLDGIEHDRKKNIEGQLSIFDIEGYGDLQSANMPVLSDFTMAEKLSMEKEITCMYLSGHPLSEYDKVANAVKADRIGDILNADANDSRYKDGEIARVIAIVTKVKLKATKSNALMAFVTIEDKYGDMEILVFPKTLADYGTLFLEGNVLEIVGSISKKEDEETKLLCNRACIAPKEIKDISNLQPVNREDKSYVPYNVQQKAPNTLYLRVPNQECGLYKKAITLLQVFDGRTPVVFCLTDSDKRLKAPQNLWVDLNDVLVAELKHQLGDENVAVK